MVADATPAVLGRYEVVKHFATGGMAEVLLARTREPQGGVHHVVLKRIRPDQASDARFVEMFLDEARIAAYLQHPNIVRVFEIGRDKTEFFFAMEYVHGEDLRKVLMEVHKRHDQLPISLITGIVHGAAAGLHHAHVQLGPDNEPLNIVHRDVSPANILIGYDGAVKVADFGIAKAALRTVETRSGTLKGKVSYMSPEQVTGKPIDRRSDVFALGIVLYEVATARRLFKGDNDFLTMSAIVQGDIPKPSLYRADFPRVLEEIVMTALAPAPNDRFQTAQELKSALEAFMASLGMRIAPHAIADYMKKLFGMRAEPWLVDDEPTATTTIDFDGSESGVVQPPDVSVREHAFPSVIRPSAGALIVAARAEVASTPPSIEQVAWLAEPSSQAHRMAWSNEPTPIRPRARGRFAAVALATAVAAGLGTFVIVKATEKPGETPNKIEMTAAPPAAETVVIEAKPAKTEPADEKADFVKKDAATKAEIAARIDPPKLAKEPPTKPEVAAKKDPPKVAVKEPPKKPEVVAKKEPPKKPEVVAKKDPPKVVAKEPAKKPDVVSKKEPPKAVAKDPPKKDPPKPVIAKKPKPPPKAPKPQAKQPEGTWDPNALFAPK